MAYSLTNDRDGDKSDNLERAIVALRHALEVYTPTAVPEKWSSAQNNLASAYRERILGKKEENIEQVILHYESALEVITRADNPQVWSLAHAHVAVCYFQREAGSRDENLEEVIVHCQHALEVQDQDGAPDTWGKMQYDLAEAYLERKCGDLSDNLEYAIARFQGALQIYTRRAWPNDWARINTNLGVAFADRMQGERAQNLEEAIDCLAQSSQVHTREAYPHQWAMIQLNLGIACSRRVRGDRAQNLEQAIWHYEQALEVLIRDAFPLDWAQTEMYLAAAYSERILGEAADNLEKALSRYEEALEVLDSEASPREWARTHTNLSHAYTVRVRGNAAENIEQAISHGKQAVQVLSRSDYPEAWARARMQLAFGFINREVGDQTGNIEQAIAYLMEALEVYSQEAYPDDWAKAQNGLALAYAVRTRGEHVDNLEKAIALWVAVWGFLQGVFRSASSVEMLGRQKQWSSVYASLVVAYLQLGKLKSASLADCHIRALEIAESGKSRLLSNQIGRADLPAPDGLPREESAREQSLAARLRDLDAQLFSSERRDPEAGGDRQVELDMLETHHSLMSELQLLWRRLEGYGPEAREYVTLRRGDAPSWDALRKSVELSTVPTACVSVSTLPQSVVLFFWRRGMHMPRPIEISLSADDLRYIYFRNYLDEVLNRHPADASGRPLTHRWRELGRRLLGPLVQLLEGIEHLVIAPEGQLHLLPLHALDVDGNGRTLIDFVSVSYTPAFGSLLRILERPQPTSGPSLSLGYTPSPAGSPESELFLGEAKAVASKLDTPAHTGSKATAALIAQHARRPLKALHLSCHGLFNQNDPLDSAVLLADGLFTARKWLGLHTQADLVTLSACQLGLSQTLGGDEFAGFTQTLLMAGGQSCLLGLWSVNALTTLHLMREFYHRWQSGASKACALRQAMLALREGRLLPPEAGLDLSDAYYWAPFALYGNWL